MDEIAEAAAAERTAADRCLSAAMTELAANDDHLTALSLAEEACAHLRQIEQLYRSASTA